MARFRACSAFGGYALTVVTLLSSALSSACGVAGDDGGVSSASGLEIGNGRETNGRETNGRETNGRETNGRETNGPRAGVWYASRAGARVVEPAVVVKGGVATRGAARGLEPGEAVDVAAQGAVRGGPVLKPTITSALANVALTSGELIGVRANGAEVRGAAFKDVYLVGRGPKPKSPALSAAGHLGHVGAIGAASTFGDRAGDVVPAMPIARTPTKREAIRAYVARKLDATNLPERDLELRVTSAVNVPYRNPVAGQPYLARWHYKVEVKEDDGAYRPFCGANADGSEKLAIAIPGKFNYVQGLDRTVTVRDHTSGTTVTSTRRERGGGYVEDASVFTFACDGASVSKCVKRLGYDPEKQIGQVSSEAASFAQPRPARDLLESCVRMFRADFCGNGISMTLDGTEIDVFDSSNVQTSSSSDWPMEASWRPDGATCGQQQRQACVPSGEGRWSSLNVKDYIDEMCPGSIDRVEDSDDHFCEASHYFPGLPSGPFAPGWPGTGPGTPPTLRTGAPSGEGATRVQEMNTNGGGGGTTWNEWDVIWTRTRFTSTSACAGALPLEMAIANGTLVAD